MEEVECDGAEDEAEDHDGDGKEQDAAPADTVDRVECDEGEGEVGEGNGEGGEGGRVEAEEAEDGGGEVH